MAYRETRARRQEQHFHPPNSVFLHHLMHIGGDEAKVFGKDRQAGKCPNERGEEFVGRHGNPPANRCRRGPDRDFPAGDKAPEMIDPHNIHQ